MTLREKLVAVMDEVNCEVAEREELIEMIAIALLTGNNLFILGKPGQAKSYSINEFRKRILGARQFERLLSKQSDEEQLFGRLDLSSLIPGGIPEVYLTEDAVYQSLKQELSEAIERQEPNLTPFRERLEDYRKAKAALHAGEPVVQTLGKIPEADIVFIDEIFKANDGVLNSLLTALNERKYTNEGHTYPIPTISFFAASNEIPNFADPQEKILEALYDRLQIKVITEDIQDRDHRLLLLNRKQHGKGGVVTQTITLDELKDMQQEVAKIPVPQTVNALMDDVLLELRKNGVFVSDRKYLNYYPLVQAKAWLSGHAAVQPQELLILVNYLWQKPSERSVVESVLQRLCINPLQSKADDIRSMAAEVKEEFERAVASSDKPSKALVKLRNEMIRLYQMQQELIATAQSDSETALMEQLHAELEEVCCNAYTAVGFTPVPLSQLSLLQ